MNCIGLIGGMGWESTVLYYQIMNREVGRRLGGLHCASLLIRSLEFSQISEMQKRQDWPRMEQLLCDAACELRAGGARCILIGSNTMHKVADAVAKATDLPLIHIADCLALEAQRLSLSKIGLLGTRLTLELPFYAEHLSRLGIETLVPDLPERERINQIIFGELFLGQLSDASRLDLQSIMAGLVDRGAQGIALGCTELPLLIQPRDSHVPLLDTTRLHATAAVEFSLTGTLPAPGNPARVPHGMRNRRTTTIDKPAFCLETPEK